MFLKIFRCNQIDVMKTLSFQEQQWGLNMSKGNNLGSRTSNKLPGVENVEKLIESKSPAQIALAVSFFI